MPSLFYPTTLSGILNFLIEESLPNDSFLTYDIKEAKKHLPQSKLEIKLIGKFEVDEKAIYPEILIMRDGIQRLSQAGYDGDLAIKDLIACPIKEIGFENISIIPLKEMPDGYEEKDAYFRELVGYWNNVAEFLRKDPNPKLIKNNEFIEAYERLKNKYGKIGPIKHKYGLTQGESQKIELIDSVLSKFSNLMDSGQESRKIITTRGLARDLLENIAGIALEVIAEKIKKN